MTSRTKYFWPLSPSATFTTRTITLHAFSLTRTVANLYTIFYGMIDLSFFPEYFPGVGDCTLYDKDRTVEDWQSLYAQMNGFTEWSAALDMFAEYGRNMNYLYDRRVFQCIVARNPEVKGCYSLCYFEFKKKPELILLFF